MRKPNVLFILTDDQGWGDLSCKGNTNLQTPNIDRLAAGGADFDWFYVTPLCAPTRAEILTGRYYPRTGVRGVTRRAECMNLDETTIGDIFAAAGYRTGYIGKWHSGSAYPYHPNGRGFEEFTGFCCGHWSHYFDSTLEHNGVEFKANGFITDFFADRAIEFIEQNQAEPFFCFLAFNVPHSPFQVPDKWYDRVRNREIRMRHRDPEKEDIQITRAILAMCENLDWNVGRVMNRIESLGLANDTIIVYLTDNGPNSHRWNGGMRGIKGHVDEGGVRSMCFMQWQGRIPAGLKIDRIAGAIDLLPTLTALADIPCRTNKPLDGVSLAPLLAAGQPRQAEWPARTIFSRQPNGQHHSLRTRQYRFGGPTNGLYDLDRDPGQNHDLSPDLPGVRQDLENRLAAWKQEMDRLYAANTGDRPLPVGCREFPRTYLAAQDGLPEGEITWSSVHPNASYFINWREPGTGIEWDIDIRNDAEYEVKIMYACRTQDVGAKMAVSCADSRLEFTITEPFISRIKDREDRVKRVESYDKEFKPLSIGRMKLCKGRANFRIEAMDVPGDEVMELRCVLLEMMA